MAHRLFGGTLVLALLATAVACGGSSSDGSARSESGGIGGSSASATGGRSGSSGNTGGSDVSQAGRGGDLSGGSGGTSGAPAGSGGSSGAPGGTGGTGGPTAGSGGAPGGGSGAGESGAGATLAGGGTGGECPTGTTDCGGICVDLSSDEDNCGDCGFSCRGLLCYVGSCEGTIPTGGMGGTGGSGGSTGGSGGSTGGSGGSTGGTGGSGGSGGSTGGSGGDPETNCLDGGGTVTTAVCCEAVGDYPNTCLDGACGCGLEYSHEVQVCNCPADYCFNGSECVLESVSAYLLWMAPGGVAGTGPAMELLEDGTLRIWQSTEGMPVRNTSGWDLELTLTPQENDELVRLMLAVDDTDLPHATDWFECAPSLYFEGSDGTSMDLDYGSATALSPEFDDVYAWLQSYFADNAPDYRGPWQYCVF